MKRAATLLATLLPFLSLGCAPADRPVTTPVALARHAASLQMAELPPAVGARFIAPTFEGGFAPAMNRAPTYIASAFERAGLQSAVRPYEYVAGVTLGTNNYLTVSHSSHSSQSGGDLVGDIESIPAYRLGADFAPLPESASDEANGLAVVFAGFGIVAPALGRDDYGSSDVSGKAVVVWEGIPENPAYPADRQLDVYSSTRQKALAARQRGARVLVVIAAANSQDSPLSDIRAPQPDAGTETSPLHDCGIAVLRVSAAVGEHLISARRSSWENTPGAEPAAGSVLAGVRLSAGADLRREIHRDANVVGVLAGLDPAHASETLVIGALWSSSRGVAGAAALIELASFFALPENRLPRTVVFAAFGGGPALLGPRRYVADPAIPFSHTVAMISLDNLGGSNARDDALPAAPLRLCGRQTAKEWDSWITTANHRQQRLDRCDSLIGIAPGIHLPFYDTGVPVLYIATPPVPSIVSVPPPSRPADPNAAIGLLAGIVEQAASAPNRPTFNLKLDPMSEETVK